MNHLRILNLKDLLPTERFLDPKTNKALEDGLALARSHFVLQEAATRTGKTLSNATTCSELEVHLVYALFAAQTDITLDPVFRAKSQEEQAKIQVEWLIRSAMIYCELGAAASVLLNLQSAAAWVTAYKLEASFNLEAIQGRIRQIEEGLRS
jgi:hypothetical protein